MNKVLSIVFIVFFISSCGDTYRNKPSHLVTPDNAAFLAATALREVNKLDIVLYPTSLVSADTYALMDNTGSFEVQNLVSQFSSDTKDQFLTGFMTGKSIKKFIKSRVRDTLKKDIETAGLRYNIEMKAGLITSAYFSRDNNQQLNDKEYYRVAVSNFFYFSGQTFPSYKYRNSLNFDLIQTGKIISLKESLSIYLRSPKFQYLDLAFLNSRVSENFLGNIGLKKTYEIQGDRHRSPYWGHKVTVRGIVTAVANVTWFPRGIDIIIQDKNGDGNDLTSDGLNIYLPEETPKEKIKIGDEFEVTGFVYERTFSSGLSKTVIRKVVDYHVISHDNERPAAVAIGRGGRKIPNRVLSKHIGDLNDKVRLSLDEGIDFWESLEGMRVKINDPKIAGFRGGREEYPNLEGSKTKGYLSLYLVADGGSSEEEGSLAGGVLTDPIAGNYSPEIIHMTANHLSGSNVSIKGVYNVGQTIQGEVSGVISYETNLFGDGEYSFVIPEAQESLKTENAESFLSGGSRLATLRSRPGTLLIGHKNDLTVGTFNVENLAGNQPKRIKKIGEIISGNMRCPDILNLVEIQDENGIALGGGSSAASTLDQLSASIKCENGQTYKWVNIDPLLHGEGGQPGGNIRVAVMYNPARVTFTPWGTPGPLETTWVTKEGNISTNPGRVFARSSEFRKTRKSIIVQFSFQGEKVILIGNHFNSKLGDGSHFGSIQPPVSRSELKRIPSATKMNQFIRDIEVRDSSANIIVAGDFNSEFNEESMKRLMGNELVNLMYYKDLVAPRDRYTHNYNGNSTAIDFIFSNKIMLDKNPRMDVLHVSSDYMGRVSDHDPIVAKFSF